MNETDRKHEVVRTRAGGVAMRSLEVGEVMHPGVGPVAEAEGLYVRQSRLAERLREPASSRGADDRLVLFDVGLGAGSNAAAARAVSEALAPTAAGAATTPTLELVSFERDLGALGLALDHAAAFGLTGAAGMAARSLLADGRHETTRTLWRLRHGDVLEALASEDSRADIIYWDPFSPRANPALWTVAAFAAARRCAGPRCTLFTYSASTSVRVALLLAGWAVGLGDATGDKQETTAAAIEAGDLMRPLGGSFLDRLSRSTASLPADAPADYRVRIARAAQFSG